MRLETYKMKPSTVVHISTVHPLFDSRIFHKECKSLASAGINVKLIITHAQEEVINDIHIIPLPLYKGRFKRIMFKPFVALSKALSTHADVFHFHDPELIPIGVLLKLCGKKVIYDVHEDVPSRILDKYWIPLYLRRVISILFKGIESFSSRFFDGIVTATPYINKIFIERNKNSININNYPLLEEINQIEIRKNKNGPQEKIISYIGVISKERGIIEVLKAIEDTDVKLYLAGIPSPASLMEELENMKGWQNVVYHGQLKRKDVTTLLAQSHIGICTLHPNASYINSLPIKIFEYMGAGLPIIASNFPYWQNLLKNVNSASFVDPLKPEEIKLAINKLIADTEKRGLMGERGMKAIREKYNWGSEEKKLLSFYRKLGVRI